MIWLESDAAERFKEFLNATSMEGPQIVARHGVEVAVFLSAREWRDLNAQTQRSTLGTGSQEEH
jgi:prevent-host-death family protein